MLTLRFIQGYDKFKLQIVYNIQLTNDSWRLRSSRPSAIRLVETTEVKCYHLKLCTETANYIDSYSQYINISRLISCTPKKKRLYITTFFLKDDFYYITDV